MKIFLVYGPTVDYDTYCEEFLGAFLNKNNAKKIASQWYEEHTNPEKSAPMSFKEYKELNMGYRAEDYEQEGPRDNLGKYSIIDFERMDVLSEYEYGTWYKPKIEEVEVLDFSIDLLKKLGIV